MESMQSHIALVLVWQDLGYVLHGFKKATHLLIIITHYSHLNAWIQGVSKWPPFQNKVLTFCKVVSTLAYVVQSFALKVTSTLETTEITLYKVDFTLPKVNQNALLDSVLATVKSFLL